MKIPFHTTKLVLSCIMLLTLTGCSDTINEQPLNNRTIDMIMDQAESALDDNPEIADSLIGLIPANKIHGKERKARYSLLFTGAEFRNHKVAKNDSLILSAVDYYSTSKNNEYRFLSHYYLGCVYTQLERYIDATIALSQAEQLADNIDNDYWIGLLYTQFGRVFRESHDQTRAIDYFDTARTYYEKAGKFQHSMRVNHDIEGCHQEIRESETQDSTMCQIQKWAFRQNFTDFIRIRINARRIILHSSVLFLIIICVVQIKVARKQKKIFLELAKANLLIQKLNETNINTKNLLTETRKQVQAQIRERHDMSNHLFNMFIDSESQEKITRQRLKTVINSLKRNYNSQENIRRIDQLLNDNFDNIMERLSNPRFKLNYKELQVMRLSISGFSAQAISVIVDDSTQNVYKIKSRLRIKIRKESEEVDALLSSFLKG